MKSISSFGQKVFILALSVFLLSSIGTVVRGQEKATKTHNDNLPKKCIIDDVPYTPMYSYWSTCAMTSFKMAASYYGYDYSVMTLMNLGWQYGATLVEDEAGPILMPGAEQPITGILYAAETLGFSAREINNQTKEEAWETMKTQISGDTPVIIQWTRHTVLSVGYDESGENAEVIYHNPAPPKGLLGSYMGVKKVRVKANPGSYVRMKKDKWFGEKYWVNANSYPAKRFEMILLEPPSDKKSIDWKSVLQRNAAKTLGQEDWSSYPPYVWYSVDAFKRAAEKVESGGWSREELNSLFSASGWGPASRSHAAAFLSGLGQSSGIDRLKEAARWFERSGYYWQEARDTWNYVKEKPEIGKVSNYRKVISGALRKVALAEGRAGKALAEAGEKFKTF